MNSDFNSKLARLKWLIGDGHTDEAMSLVESAENCDQAARFIRIVLGHNKSAPELVALALVVFLNRQHDGWLASLLSFTDMLWNLRLINDIKLFNALAFRRDDDCALKDRLIIDFVNNARWCDDPADFSITPPNLLWFNWQSSSYVVRRIKAGKFESEEAFIRWRLNQTDSFLRWDDSILWKMVQTGHVRSLINRLKELGTDTTEFDNLERNLLTSHLAELEKEYEAEVQEWRRECLRTGIRVVRNALA